MEDGMKTIEGRMENKVKKVEKIMKNAGTIN